MCLFIPNASLFPRLLNYFCVHYKKKPKPNIGWQVDTDNHSQADLERLTLGIKSTALPQGIAMLDILATAPPGQRQKIHPSLLTLFLTQQLRKCVVHNKYNAITPHMFLLYDLMARATQPLSCLQSNFYTQWSCSQHLLTKEGQELRQENRKTQ